MSSDRIRLLALALLCAALTLAVRRSIQDAVGRRAPDEALHPASVETPEAAWVIPVEIVEAGQAPRRHEVRVSR